MDNAIDIAGGTLIAIVVIVVIALRKRASSSLNLDSGYFQRRWLKVQKLCSDKKLWYKAVIDADELLDEALKQRHFKGKTTGERLVAAQHHFTSNDKLWFSHKLKNHIKEDDFRKLSKQQTLEALASFKAALKDIGALGERKSKS